MTRPTKPTVRELIAPSTRKYPCPDRACAGDLTVPYPPRPEPVDVECDGLFPHRYTIRRFG